MGAEVDQYRKARQAKAAQLREMGIDPFGERFNVSHSIAQARALAPDLNGDGEQQPRGERVCLAGRIGNLRKAGGKLMFGTLFDRSRGDLYQQQQVAGVTDLDGAEAKKARGIQLFFERRAMGDEQWPVVKQGLDLADWIGVEGPVGRTKTGEVSVFVERMVVLGKTMLPPPQQAGASSGVLSPELRQRQRELDLVMNDGSLATFVMRSRLIAAVRAFFVARDFLEVETPMMHPVLGGAAARPFVTHHNALDKDLFLRIAPELYLKRLIVGGLERVFELNRNFRNEGLSPRHNPEFTMIEWYQAYADHELMMELTQELFRHLADQLFGTRTLRLGAQLVDLNQPFRRFGYHQALQELGGIDYRDQEAVRAKATALELDPDDFPSYDRLLNEVWEAVVEPHLQAPTFITDQPTWLTPLCRCHADRPDLTRRFELFIGGMEIGNAYSELNDPDLQRQRFQEQLSEAEAAQDDEAGTDGSIDQDYCTALDHGLPVCGGQGIGIDRLVMLFTGVSTIRDVILFPAMR
jgi:lysyl-tRNA synthetase, class II